MPSSKQPVITNNEDDVVSFVLDESNSSSNTSNDADMGSGSSESCRDGSGRGAATEEAEQVIAKKETKAVGRLKYLVFLVLIVSASIVAASVYFYISNSEHTKFQTAFEDDSTKVLATIGTSLDKTMGLLDSLSVLFVSFSRITNQTWPYVTMPDFAVRMAKILPLTDAISVNLLPIVHASDRREWEEYSVANDQWVDQGMALQDEWDGYYGPKGIYNGKKNNVLHTDFEPLPYSVRRTFLPLWQNFPVIPNTTWTYNWDWMSLSFNESYVKCLTNHKTTISTTYMTPTPGDPVEVAETEVWAEYYKDYIPDTEEVVEPMSDLSYPIVNDISHVNVAGADDYDPQKHDVLGMLTASFRWQAVIRDILPHGSDGIVIVFENACADPFTYELRGPLTTYLGVGDKHDIAYNHMSLHSKLYDLHKYTERDSVYSGAPIDKTFCPFTLHVYPSDLMKAKHITWNPVLFSAISVLIFVFTSLVFHLYDVQVEARQLNLLRAASRSAAIVSSLFPSAVRDRLYPAAQSSDQSQKKRHTFMTEKVKRMNQGPQRDDKNSTEFTANHSSIAGSPIAELYPNTTVLFADIAGFTAWSATRQPTEVFTLLETLYAAFDEIAKHRGVFKVETIGDCYVAVVGLPTPRAGHAVVMTRFARDCRNKMQELTVDLEKTLGEGTADLALRIGLNSGPTTAGVLRGEKSRFQLFGDTVNTAARMESNGERNRIHVSESTADLIRGAGKSHWLTPREEKVDCKGKGLLTTFWCEPKSESAFALDSSCSASEIEPSASPISAVVEGLINWNVDMFSELLKDVILHLSAQGSASKGSAVECPTLRLKAAAKPIDEIQEVLTTLAPSTRAKRDISATEISPTVATQLRDLITAIALMYHSNPFHNFEHCSQVAMTTKKLLDCVREHGMQQESTSGTGTDDSVCNVLSNAITRLAILFAALIHDIDHPGVSNAQLVHEGHVLALVYAGKSVAEQHAIVISLRLLMEPRFDELRHCFFTNEAETHQFRQVMVHSVLATDLFDTDLQTMRESRWANMSCDDTLLVGNLCHCRATAIVDLIIQASDVSHTMQHFTVYKKWNMRLLSEMYAVHNSGRADKNPLEGWYDGELWFFDQYVIPLAQKLRECGLFGTAGCVLLEYAVDNRSQWETTGRSILYEEMVALLEGRVCV